MADWVNILDSSVDPDAPLTSELGYSWRDNPIAIAEGAAGAPRVRAAAISTTTGSLSGSLVAGANVEIDIGARAFFPSIRSPNTMQLFTAGGTGGDPDAAGFRILNNGTVTNPYAVNWRRIN